MLNKFSVWSIVYSELVYLGFTINTIILLQSYILLGVMGFIFILVWKIKLFQVNRILNSTMCLPKKLLFFRWLYIKNIVHCLINHVFFGEMFLATVVINYPLNLAIVMHLILHESIFSFKILMTLVMGEQVLSIVGVHIASAFFNGKQLIAAKDMMTMFITTKHRFRTQTKIKQNLFVETFYTKKEYGMTYGKFGLISMFSFLKVTVFPSSQIVIFVFSLLCCTANSSCSI